MGQFEAIIGVNFWTALFVLLNTLTIFFVGKKFLFKPVMEMIQSRQKEIDDMYAQADCARSNAQSMEKEYRQKLETAAEDGERIVKEAVARGQARQEQILREANSQADALREKASADIALEKKKALNDAKDELSEMALAIAEKVVGRTVEQADQDRLVDDFIAGLGDAQ